MTIEEILELVNNLKRCNRQEDGCTSCACFDYLTHEPGEKCILHSKNFHKIWETIEHLLKIVLTAKEEAQKEAVQAITEIVQECQRDISSTLEETLRTIEHYQKVGQIE